MLIQTPKQLLTEQADSKQIAGQKVGTHENLARHPCAEAKQLVAASPVILCSVLEGGALQLHNCSTCVVLR
jgi:hypothetical protein